MMKLYVYCVADRNPGFVTPQVGLGANEVEFLKFGDLVVGASKFGGEVVEVNRENAMAHDAVVRRIFSEVTVLPFRFGTLITNEKLDSYMRSKHISLAERLASLQNCVEMSVKVIWRNDVDSKPQNTNFPSGLGEGTAFLLSKREQIRADDQLSREAGAIAGSLANELGSLIRSEKVTIEPRQKLVVSASYLIERGSETDFRELLKEVDSERSDLHFLTSGPWPPYTFANIELEFETHFGVS